MKKIILLTLTLCLFLVPALALGDSILRTEGSATLTIAPDRAVLSVGYAGENAESSVAQEETAKAIDAVVSAVTALGIEESDIATSSLNIYPVYDYADGGSRVRGYRVEHMLNIIVLDMETVGDVMDAALSAGANQAYGITFVSSREEEVYLQALALAVEKAAAKADALAIATGVWLGALEEVNEMSSVGYYGGPQSAMKADAAAGASIGGTIMAGELKVTATVELVYGIR